MIQLCALALLLQTAAPAAEGGIEVHSAGGYFHARLAKVPGQERVPDVTARWKLRVSDAGGRELWACFQPGPRAGQRFLLAQDGSAFAIVEELYGDAQVMLQLRGPGERDDQIFGGQLRIAPAQLRAAEPPGTWLAPGDDSARFSWTQGPFGPLQMLDLTCIDGVVRKIDLASGLPLDAGGGRVPVLVEPAFEKETVPPSVVPAVLRSSAPAEVRGDEVLIVTVEGQHPTPGWKVFAFSLEAGGPDGTSLVIKPRAKPPLPVGNILQKIEPYTAEARLMGLPPGEHLLEVHGTDGLVGTPMRVLVRPGGAFARLHVSGGMLGLDETVSLFENGVVGVESNRTQRNRVAFADPQAFAVARAQLNALLALPPGPASPGSDFMKYTLTWRVADRWHEVSGDDSNVRGELRRAIDALQAVGSGG